MTDSLNLPLKPLSSSEQIITSLAQRSQVLRRLLDNRCLLSVSLAGQKEIFLSAILSVNRRDSTFDIDELNPTVEQGVLLASPLINITGQLQGVSVRFSTSISQIQTIDGDAYYVLTFPEKIFYAQQREYYRIYISMLRRPSIRLEFDDQEYNSGEIANISLGGVLAVLPRDVKLTTGDRVPNCNIKFNNEEEITATIEIRHQRVHPKTGQIEAGLIFLNLNKEQKKLLRKHATRIEREIARSS